MKKITPITFSVLILCLLMSVSSCKKDETKTVSYNLEERDVWNYSTEGEDEFEVRPVDVQNAFLTAGVAYDVSKVTTAKLTSLKAEVTDGYSLLSNFTRIDVYIKLSGVSGNGTRIAHLASSPTAGTTSVQLVTDGAELKGYLGSQSTVTIITESSTYDQEVTLKNGVIQAEVKE